MKSQASCVQLPVTKAMSPAGSSVSSAHSQLVGALTDMKAWADRGKVTKELMYSMLKNRSSMQELATRHNAKCVALAYNGYEICVICILIH